MRIFLSAVENGSRRKLFSQNWDFIERNARSISHSIAKTPFLWNLMSYYYLQSDLDHACRIRDNSDLVLIDSGAHSFQKGKKVAWEDYTHDYARFIREFDRDNVVGYFEMDIDNIIGYDAVLRLRSILHEESGHPEKIIPVWHKGRGVPDFIRMCEEHAGRTVAVTGFKNEDIRDEQYPMFLREAKKHGCKVHCLGMTRKKVLDKVPFDYVDSSSWAQSALYGRVGGRKVSKAFSKTDRDKVFIAAYMEAMKMQVHYYAKWRKLGEENHG